eukprot:scaffold175608_cov32-Tisochrysis_lutea.AAC.2
MADDEAEAAMAEDDAAVEGATEDNEAAAEVCEQNSTMMPALGGDGWAVYPSVIERYYTTYTTSNNQALHVHSNGLCLLSLARSHPLLAPGAPPLASISFRSHDKKNLLSNAVRGKRKAGAIFMLPRDMVATVTTQGGAEPVTLYACMRGNIIEINRRLIDNPELLRDATGRGWLAVLMPKLAEKSTVGAALLEYDKANPLDEPSTNQKRRLEDLPVRSNRKTAKTAAKSCWEFAQKGTCKFGTRCRFSHGSNGPTLVSTNSATAHPQDTTPCEKEPAEIAAATEALGVPESGDTAGASEETKPQL